VDVDDVAEYSAFLLPNPYRLIIDIHGKLPAQQVAAVKPEVKPALPKSASADKDKDPQPASDVTVTQVKPSTGAKTPGSATAALDQAEKAKPGPIRAAGKETKPADSTSATARSKPAAEKTVEVARVDTVKVVNDDASLKDDESAHVGKPTTGPTFQAIAPQQSSRNRKKVSETVASGSKPST